MYERKEKKFQTKALLILPSLFLSLASLVSLSFSLKKRHMNIMIMEAQYTTEMYNYNNYLKCVKLSQ